MRPNARSGTVGLLAAAALVLVLVAGCRKPPEPAANVGAEWIRPIGGPGGEPIWGRAGGLGVGVWPTSGPRGLIRVSPYLDQPHPRMLTYIVVEPVIGGAAQSELEPGPAGRGLPMMTGHPEEAATATQRPRPADILREPANRSPTFWLAVGLYRNGARPSSR